MKPIKPSEVIKKKKEAFPDEAIEAFNELIAENFQGNKATVRQKDVAALIAKKMNISVDDVFKNHYLDVEDIFKKGGWKVEYDKPGWDEDYEAYFVFTAKPGV